MSGWVTRPDGSWFNEAAPVTISETIPSEVLLVKAEDHTVPSPSITTLKLPKSALSLNTQAQHSVAYRSLHQKIIDAGLYRTPYITGYGPEVVRYVFLAVGSAYAYRYNWLNLSAFLLGAMWHQLVFTVHDLGHMGVTHDWNKDRLISIFLADFVGGLSVGWWVEVSLGLNAFMF
jgi:delta8-fatty-acid desaturase